MFTQIKLNNFQGFGLEQAVPLKPITLIYGPNASGKSSILRALRLVTQSIGVDRGWIGMSRASGFLFDGDMVSLASYANAVFRHEVSEDMQISLSVRSDQAQSSRNRQLASFIEEVTISWTVSNPGRIDILQVEFKVDPQGRPFSLKEGELSPIIFTFERDGNSQNRFDLISWSGRETLKDLFRFGATEQESEDLANGFGAGYVESSLDLDWEEILEGSSYELRGLMVQPFHSSRATGRENEISENSRSLRLGGAHQQIFLSDLMTFPRILLNRHALGMQFIGPLREIDQRLTFHEGSIEVADDGPSNRRSQSEINRVISSWLEKLTGGRYSFELLEFTSDEVAFFGLLRTPVVVDKLTGTKVTFQDVGVGLSQVLPILRALQIGVSVSPSRPHVVLIEQPELHLHPRMQADLIDLIAEFCKSRPGTQIIAETHSEAFLMRLQKKLRAGQIDKSMVQILFVDSDEVGNFVTSLALTPEREFEVEFPLSFSGLRLSEYL